MKIRGQDHLGFAWLAGAALWPLTALAQAQDLRQELGRCAALPEVNARVACYDTLARDKPIAPAVRQPSLATKAPEPGAARREIIAHPNVSPLPEDAGDQALIDKVASLKEVQPNKLQITLANGQVWQQTVSKAFFIRVHDSVRIAGTGWGHSFRLVADGHPDFIQVRRLR